MLKIELTPQEGADLRGLLDLVLKQNGLPVGEVVVGIDRKILAAGEAMKEAAKEPGALQEPPAAGVET